MNSTASITPLHPRSRRAKATTPRRTARQIIRRDAGIVEQVKIALSREHLLATMIGMLLGGVVPFATFCVSHHELAGNASWYEPRLILVLGGLLYSATTVFHWGRLALGSTAKAVGFTVLLEGVMVFSHLDWLSVIALCFLVGINAIATGVTLARGTRARRTDEDV